jgi:hypothetical protein
MRRILVENARRKRGGDRSRTDLDEIPLAAPEPRENLLAPDEALTRLAAADLVQLRYFAALTLDEAALVPGNSPPDGGSSVGLCAGLAATGDRGGGGTAKKL